MDPLTIGGEPLAFQSAQNDFMVRLKASAARRFPSGVWRPLPGAEPCNRQRFSGLPSAPTAHFMRQGSPVLRACAPQIGQPQFRRPTISSHPHDTRARLRRSAIFSPIKPFDRRAPPREADHCLPLPFVGLIRARIRGRQAVIICSRVF
jgi:hypothetical protein